MIDIIRKRGIVTIAGNHDAKVQKLTAGQMAEPGKNYGYVLLTLHEYGNNTVAESIDVQFIRVEYDIEAAAEGIERSPLPPALADMLRLAFWKLSGAVMRQA